MKKILVLSFLSTALSVYAADYDEIYEGHYVWGAEVHIFSPCESEVAYWVSFNWAGTEMSEFYKTHLDVPYQPMYLKFRGHLLDEVVDGFAIRYDGLIHISEVMSYSFEVPKSCS